MMKKDDETEAFLNYLYGNKDKPFSITKPYSDQYIRDMMTTMMARKDMSSVQYHKHKLGKQSFCKNIFSRHWVWEGDNWRVYVSKEGVSFEVLATLSFDEAWAAYQDYYNRIK